jgi:hypothetical protein
VNTPETVSHEQATELLPWLVNDSLVDKEKESVLEHAQSCVICRRDLDDLEQLRDSIMSASSLKLIPAPDMRNVNARIDALIDRQNRGSLLIARLREAFESPWRIAFVAQSVLLVVLASVLLWSGPRDAEFTTLTQPDHLPDGHYIRVVFSPELTQSEFIELLDNLELTIVDGPSSRGVYTLGVAKAMSVDDHDKLVTDLQGEPNVLFAQPVNRGAKQ